MIVQIVRLTSDRYTAPAGTLGVIAKMHFDKVMVTPYSVDVNWVGPPEGPGGSSSPVLPEDLEVVGSVAVPKER